MKQQITNTQKRNTQLTVVGFCGKAGSGKDAAAEILVRRLFFHRIAFADSLKRIAKDVFGWDGKKDERGRRLLQRLGTEVGREYDHDFWVRKLEEAIPQDAERIVVPDVRFPNEVEWIRSRGGTVFRMIGRGGLVGEASQHPSETAIEKLDLPEIDNSGSLDCLERALLTLVSAATTATGATTPRRFRRV